MGNQTDNDERNPLAKLYAVGLIVSMVGTIFGWGTLIYIGIVLSLIPLAIFVWREYL